MQFVNPTEHHPPVEEYLRSIESLAEEGAPVIQARLAERLGRTAPSVREMLDRLAADGYIVRSGRVIELTEHGRAVATRVIRRHRLAERLLIDVIQLPWHLVHEEAGRWEHVISDEVEARLIELLGDPATCPHGNVIPGTSSKGPSPTTQLSLAEAAPGQRLQLLRVTEQVEADKGALCHLSEAGFVPGATARVTDKGPDGTLILEVGNRTVAMGTELCRGLLVVAS